MARTIPTPFGNLTVRTTSEGDVILVETEGDSLTINGIGYRPSGIFRQETRPWGTYVHFTHYNGLRRDLTDNARRKLTDWAQSCWAELSREDERLQAQINAAKSALHYAEQDMQAAQRKHAEAQITLEKLLDR